MCRSNELCPLTCLFGGSASGKSAAAEELAGAGPGPRFYIATMEPYGEDGRRRIARHRQMRADKGFETIERYTDLENLILPAKGTPVLECLGNLAANEMFSPAGAGPEGALGAILRGVEQLRRQCARLIVVGNDVFSDGVEQYEPSTRQWIAVMAQAHRQLARQADRVCETVCGIPLWQKGAAE